MRQAWSIYLRKKGLSAMEQHFGPNVIGGGDAWTGHDTPSQGPTCDCMLWICLLIFWNFKLAYTRASSLPWQLSKVGGPLFGFLIFQKGAGSLGRTVYTHKYESQWSEFPWLCTKTGGPCQISVQGQSCMGCWKSSKWIGLPKNYLLAKWLWNWGDCKSDEVWTKQRIT